MKPFFIITSFILVLIPGPYGFSMDIKSGTNEINGTASFSMDFNNRYYVLRLNLSPSYCYYPANRFFIGPLLTYSKNWHSRFSEHFVWVGGTAGMLLSNNQTCIPYLGAGLEYFYGTYYPLGYSLPAFVGYKVRLSESFFLNIQPTYTYTISETNKYSTLLLGFGFSGIF